MRTELHEQVCTAIIGGLSKVKFAISRPTTFVNVRKYGGHSFSLMYS
eukprot:SAG31_NODE_34567_length_331_cov_1.340517_1_plen_46_part_10